MKRIIDWAIIITCLAGACWVMRAQDAPLREKIVGPTNHYDIGGRNLPAPRSVYRLVQYIPSASNTSAITVLLCGTEHSHPHADMIHVSCVDYDALRRISPGVPVPEGKRTQVLIQAKRGDFVAVTVDGQTKHQDLLRDAWGRLVALVSFEGMEYKTLSVKIGAWLE